MTLANIGHLILSSLVTYLQTRDHCLVDITAFPSLLVDTELLPNSTTITVNTDLHYKQQSLIRAVVVLVEKWSSM